MRISTKIRLNLLLYVSLFLGASGLLLYSFTNLKQLVDEEQQVEKLFTAVLELSHLTERYFVTPEIVELWRERYRSLYRNLTMFQDNNRSQTKRVELIVSQYRTIYELFNLVQTHENNAPAEGELREASIRFHNQLQVKFHDILTHFTQYNAIKRAAIVRAERIFIGVIIGSFGFGIMTALFLFFWLRTSILKPLGQLIDATKVVGSGRLCAPSITRSNDEIGDLAGAFTEMTQNLAHITTSRDNLEREIHDRKQAEADRLAAENQLRQAQQLEAIGTMAGGFAHRFNNLLAMILGYTEIAQEETAPDTEIRQHLRKITQAGVIARDLVANIMTFSNQSVSCEDQLDTKQIARQKITKLQQDPRLADSFTFHLECGTNLQPIRMNVRYFSLIIDKLIQNSLDAMDDGGTVALRLEMITLTNTLSTTVSPLLPGKYVLLTVTDSGCGFDADTAKRIFDPFFTTKDVGQGDGIGLAMVLGLVARHGGSVGVESSPGQGSSFFVYLPVQNNGAMNCQITEEFPPSKHQTVN